MVASCSMVSPLSGSCCLAVDLHRLEEGSCQMIDCYVTAHNSIEIPQIHNQTITENNSTHSICITRIAPLCDNQAANSYLINLMASESTSNQIIRPSSSRSKSKQTNVSMCKLESSCSLFVLIILVTNLSSFSTQLIIESAPEALAGNGNGHSRVRVELSSHELVSSSSGAAVSSARMDSLHGSSESSDDDQSSLVALGRVASAEQPKSPTGAARAASAPDRTRTSHFHDDWPPIERGNGGSSSSARAVENNAGFNGPNSTRNNNHNPDHKLTATSQNNENLNSNFNNNHNKFRVNVSNICERDRMQITIRTNKPFYGLIHAKDKRKRAQCSQEGNGNQAYLLYISYTQVQSDSDYCGVVAHQQPASLSSTPAHHLDSPKQTATTLSNGLHTRTNHNHTTNNIINGNYVQQANHSHAAANQQILSLVLVVRLHKTIEFSEDRYFLLSCSNRCSRPNNCSRSNSNEPTPNSQPTQSSPDQQTPVLSTNGHQLSNLELAKPKTARNHQRERASPGTGSHSSLMTSDSSVVPRFRVLPTTHSSDNNNHEEAGQIVATGSARSLLVEPPGAASSTLARHQLAPNWLPSHQLGALDSAPSSSSPKSFGPDCDPQLEVKFQWLARLCLILCLLTTVMFLVSFFLWLQLRRRKCQAKITNDQQAPTKSRTTDYKSSRSRQQRQKAFMSIKNKNKKPQLDRKSSILAPDLHNQTVVSNWYEQPLRSHDSSATSTDDGATTNSSYIVISNQGTGDLAPQSHHNDDSNGAFQHSGCQPTGQVQLSSAARSLETFGRQSSTQTLSRGREKPGAREAAKNPTATMSASNSSLVKRRRSIGAAMGGELSLGAQQQRAADMLTLVNEQNHQGQMISFRNHHSGTNRSAGTINYMDANGRAKSRSQVTIHYEQKQDPFKAIAFASLGAQFEPAHVAYTRGINDNSSCRGEGGEAKCPPPTGPKPTDNLASEHKAARRVGARVLANDCQRSVASQHQSFNMNYETPDSEQQEPGVVHLVQATPLDWLQNPIFYTTTTAQNPINNKPKLEQQQMHLLEQQLIGSSSGATSQFDPQNSRKLVDLIQQKHQSQLSHANLTASNLQQQSELLAELQQQQQQQFHHHHHHHHQRRHNSNLKHHEPYQQTNWQL